MSEDTAIEKASNKEGAMDSAFIDVDEEAGAAASQNEHEHSEGKPPHCDAEGLGPNISTTRIGEGFPGAFAVGGNVDADDAHSLTEPESEVVEPSPTKPLTARVVQNTEEDYQVLQEELHQLQRAFAERDNVAIAEVVAVDEEAQHGAGGDVDNAGRKGKRLMTIFCGSRTKRIASISITLLVIVGTIVGVAVPLSKSTTLVVFTSTKCQNAMNTADQDDDQKLKQREYFIFVNTYTNDFFEGGSFPELPQPLRRNFWQWSNKGDGIPKIDISGSQGEAADAAQIEFLNTICTETEATAKNLPPTLEPTSLPSPTMSPSAPEPADSPPPRPPTSLPTVGPTANIAMPPIAAPIGEPTDSALSPPNKSPTFPCSRFNTPTC